jgi:pimeloyl-ACP methyl ester carboxylesterase
MVSGGGDGTDDHRQTGLDEDVAATKRVLDQQDGPIILVGHSYGGSIITVAGSDPKVKALVYVAALQSDVGETSAEVAPPKQQATNDLRTTKDGFKFLYPQNLSPKSAPICPSPRRISWRARRCPLWALP